jgi:hypothetical protein
MPLKSKYKEVCHVEFNGSWQTRRSNSIARVLKAKYNADEYLKVSGLNSIVRPGSLTNEPFIYYWAWRKIK